MNAVDTAPAASELSAPPMVRRCFRAMGTDVELMGQEADATMLDAGQSIIADLEQHWSRFRPTSDLSRLNAAGGGPVILPAITFDLVAQAVDFCRRTGGWFDPSVLPALEASGYDRTFDELVPEPDLERPTDPVLVPDVPGVDGIELQPSLRLVRLPSAVRLDLGGIGKGRAADLVAEYWAASGLTGCVNLGGDLRAVGRGADGAWPIAVDDPFDPTHQVALIGIVDGAVATSSTTSRVWTHAGTTRHHLIDPRTGLPSAQAPGSVTVVASTAVEAEVWAKAALLAGPTEGRRLLTEAGLPGLLVDADGSQPINGMEAYLW